MTTANEPEQYQTVEGVAARYGADPERVRVNYRANAADLARMAAKADRTGRKVGGATADELRAMSAKMSLIADAPPQHA